jgi:hypothetical protein
MVMVMVMVTLQAKMERGDVPMVQEARRGGGQQKVAEEEEEEEEEEGYPDIVAVNQEEKPKQLILTARRM